jgi:hypothetical protein
MAVYRVEASGGAPIERWFFTGEIREKSELNSHARLISLYARA